MTKIKLVLGSIGGAVAIQLAFAACFSSTGDQGGPGGSDAGVMGAMDAMMDVVAKLMDASTHDAKAAVDAGMGGQTIVGTLDVANEDCSQVSMVQVPGQTAYTETYTYAVHAYPSMTAAQLSQVRTIGHLSPTFPGYPGSNPMPSYSFAGPESLRTGTGYPQIVVQDGSVAVLCSESESDTGASSTWFDSVTFTLVK